MRQRLGALGAAIAEKAGEAVAEHISASSVWREASTVALFSTLKGEVDTAPLIQLARSDGKRMLFPRTVPGFSLEFACVEDAGRLRQGRYGVLEPPSGCATQALTSDVVVFVPGLAFDRGGGRLGRGAGYYDRTFAATKSNRGRPQLIGVGFAIQIVESVPVTSVDVRMDRIVTDNEFFQTA
jgi:5-formyltetrahydrofolate cyclo-ligase